MAGVAQPVNTPDTGNAWLDSIMWGTQWTSSAAAGEPTSIAFYMAGLNGAETVTLDTESVTATTPYTEEMTAMLSAMQTMEAVANIQFFNVASQTAADIIWASVDDADADGALGWANPPGTAYNSTVSDFQSLIAINYEAYNPDSPDQDLLVRGGFDYVTYIHELGHALGLAHPHDTGGGSTIAPGVSSPFGDYGDFALNQGIYSMMSYNDGWQTGPLGVTPSPTYGYEIGPMAFDIAALQRMYGANTAYHAGNDVYALPTANAAGTGYLCIWDAGGRDRIVGDDGGNTINLLAATLLTGIGGGGFVSHATAIHGGFTIANGVVIENATGGDGRDILIGNFAANILEGMDENDQLNGGGGADVLRAGEGNDVLNGGIGADTLRGVGGNDIYYVDNGADNVIEGIGTGTDQVRASVSYSLAAGQSIDTLATGGVAGTSGIDLTGNELAQTLLGNAGNNILNGLAGADTLRGFGGFDSFRFSAALGSGVDRIVDFSPVDDTIQLYKSVFTALTAGQLTTSAYKDIGDPGAVVDEDDRILYDDDTGALFYDSNGSLAGERTQFATLNNMPATLTAPDFFVVA